MHMSMMAIYSPPKSHQILFYSQDTQCGGTWRNHWPYIQTFAPLRSPVTSTAAMTVIGIKSKRQISSRLTVQSTKSDLLANVIVGNWSRDPLFFVNQGLINNLAKIEVGPIEELYKVT